VGASWAHAAPETQIKKAFPKVLIDTFIYATLEVRAAYQITRANRFPHFVRWSSGLLQRIRKYSANANGAIADFGNGKQREATGSVALPRLTARTVKRAWWPRGIGCTSPARA
jgi:hypothetical protein